MATNLYGGVKDAATGKPVPAGLPAATPNGKQYSAQADSEKRREIREATNGPADRAAIVEVRGTNYLKPQTPEEARAMTEQDMRWLAVTPFEGELEAIDLLAGLLPVDGKCAEWQEAAYIDDPLWWAFFFMHVVSNEYFAIDRMYWEIPARPGELETKIVSKPCNPQDCKERTIGYQVALGMVIAQDKNPDKKAPDSDTPSRNQPESADKISTNSGADPHTITKSPHETAPKKGVDPQSGAKPAILPQDVQDNTAALEAIALKDSKLDAKVALNNAVMAELGKVVEGTNRCLKVAECFLQARGLEVYLCHRQNAAGIVVGTSLTEGDPVRPVFRMADLERFLMSIGDKAETPEPAPVAAKPYTPPPARPPRKGYPAWLVREYAGIGPLETL